MANWTYKITYTTRTGFAESAEKTAEIVAPTSRQAFETLEAQHPGEKIRIIAADSRRALALHVIDHQDAQTARITCATFTSADVARKAIARKLRDQEAQIEARAARVRAQGMGAKAGSARAKGLDLIEAWLCDNVDQESTIYFDNGGTIGSAELLALLFPEKYGHGA